MCNLSVGKSDDTSVWGGFPNNEKGIIEENAKLN